MSIPRFVEFVRRLAADARHFQIAFLAVFVTLGIGVFEFDIRPSNAVTMVVTAQIAQYVCTKTFGLPFFDARSPLISSLSLCLLLRTNSVGLAAAAAAIAILSKFLVRWQGKHIFNPTNIAIVALVLLTDEVWISSGQWGSGVWVAFLAAGLGGIVAYRASRADIAVALLILHAGVLFARAWRLGDPMAIPVHSLQSGALLIFAFFMISDPRTTPNSRLGRFVFAALVVWFGWYVQFRLFEPNGLLYGLALFSPIVPILDWLIPGLRFEWNQGSGGARKPKGASHEQSYVAGGAGLPVPDAAR